MLATSSITVESTTWIGILKRKAGARRWPATKRGDRVPRCSNVCQNSFSAIAAGRCRFAWDSPFRLGGRASRIVESAPECNRSASHTSLSPMLWVSCAYSRLTR